MICLLNNFILLMKHTFVEQFAKMDIVIGITIIKFQRNNNKKFLLFYKFEIYP